MTKAQKRPSRARDLEQRRPLRELVSTSEVSDLFRLEYSDVRFWYPWHFHPEVEIKQVISGAGTRTIGDSLLPFSSGDLCLVGARTPHTWQSKAVRGKWVSARVVQFGELLFSAESGGAQEIRELLLRSRRGLQVTGRTRSAAERELTRLMRARSEARKLGHLTTLLAILAEGAGDVVELASAASVDECRDANDAFVDEVLAFMGRHVVQRMSESDAAAEFGLSASAFSRRFKRAFEKTYSGYMAELRTARASNLLLHTEQSVAEIAKESGFGTVAGLNRHFRSIKGTTPTAYRRQARALNSGFHSDEETIIRCGGIDAPSERRAC